MKKVKVTGGAKIGKFNATWPFATLKASREKLELSATIVGNLVFRPADIISFEEISIIPFLKQGVKINHRVEAYKSEVIFWTFSNPQKLIIRIKQTRILTNSNPLPLSLDREITASQAGGSFPIKTSAAIGIVVICVVLFLGDFINIFDGNEENFPLGIGAQLAIGFLFLTSLLLLIFQPIRPFILKEGRKIADIKNFLLYIMLFCGIMLLAITQIPNSMTL